MAELDWKNALEKSVGPPDALARAGALMLVAASPEDTTACHSEG
eukprot:COSAG01_NODE_16186_length_1262_cov_1.091144_1_plen_43_part_10